MDNLTTVHGHVSGRVQGVWFRAFIKTQAVSHNLNGWAKNLADRRVEFMLTGDSEDIDQVLKSLHQGPENASVTAVESNTVAYQSINSFIIA